MRRTAAVFFAIICFLKAQSESGLLSKEKQQIQEQKYDELVSSSKKLRYNWLNPLSIGFSHANQQSASTGAKDATRKAYIDLGQDIFRSGGIYYAIKYADSKKSLDISSWDKENAALNGQLYASLLNARNDRNKLLQSQLRLKNMEIEIFIKRQQYEAGDVDITQLNNAIMNRNFELKNVMAIKQTLANDRLELQKLTDLKEDEIELPVFVPISKSSYVKNSYNAENYLLQAKSYDYKYYVVRSAYLPRVSVNGQYGRTEYDNFDRPADYDGDYYYLGLSLSIPLDYNMNVALQEAKAVSLRSKAEAADKIREEEIRYEQIKETIESYEEYIKITKENIGLYDELIETTRQGVDSGYKSGYDLATLENTKQIDEYEIKINEINIQRELAKLYFSTRRGE